MNTAIWAKEHLAQSPHAFASLAVNHQQRFHLIMIGADHKETNIVVLPHVDDEDTLFVINAFVTGHNRRASQLQNQQKKTLRQLEVAFKNA